MVNGLILRCSIGVCGYTSACVSVEKSHSATFKYLQFLVLSIGNVLKKFFNQSEDGLWTCINAIRW